MKPRLAIMLWVLILAGCNSARKSAGSDTSESGRITEKYWKLIDLKGRPVAPPAEGSREAHMVLKTGTSRVQGSGGCNSFSGEYGLQSGNRITFKPILTTMMSCDDTRTEDAFLSVFPAAAGYVVKDDTLVLQNSRKELLARFVAVYMQ